MYLIADVCLVVFSSIMRPSAGSVCARCSLILVQVLVLVHPAAGYNLDQEHSLEFSGPPSSMFGYSVLLHRHGAHNWSGFILLICDEFTIDLFGPVLKLY